MPQEQKKSWQESLRFNFQSWRLLKGKVNFRYWLLWMVNLFIVVGLTSWLSITFELNFFLGIAIILLCYILSPLTLLLWLPQYLKQKKSHLYRGALKSIGDWIGMPYHNQQ